jgi:hypothetical protein
MQKIFACLVVYLAMTAVGQRPSWRPDQGAFCGLFLLQELTLRDFNLSSFVPSARPGEAPHSWDMLFRPCILLKSSEGSNHSELLD